jgi:cytochrome c556
MRSRIIAVASILTAVSAAAVAGPIEDQIRNRQSAYSLIGWNMGKIKQQVVDKPGTYNKDQVVAASNAIAAIANSGLGALFGPGTEKGVGWHETKVKPEFFTETEKVRKVATQFNREATELAKVATAGDVAAIKSQFGKVGETCKSCHNSYRIRD